MTNRHGICLVMALAVTLLAGTAHGEPKMELGSFSISLAVKDIAASRDFYAKLGFTEAGGDASQNWLILKNGDHVIGLFQGMFERNVMTFNPGWNQANEAVDPFTDVRDLQRALREQGMGGVLAVGGRVRLGQELADRVLVLAGGK